VGEARGRRQPRSGTGRFSLNDLHKASGSAVKHKLVNWTMLLHTRRLVDEIKQGCDSSLEPLVVVHGGTERGTYVCKELVYGYAMWISPKFHLAVIRAYDALVTRPVAAAVALLPDLKLPEFR
jgi:hypothetical protein